MTTLKWVLTSLALAILGSSLLVAQNTKHPRSDRSIYTASLQSILEQRENAFWKAYKDKDKKTFVELTTEDFTAVIVDGAGERDRQGTLDSMDPISISDYKFSGFKLTSLAPNTAMLRYAKGQRQEQKVAVTDIWVNRGGKWKSIRYQETGIDRRTK